MVRPAVSVSHGPEEFQLECKHWTSHKLQEAYRSTKVLREKYFCDDPKCGKWRKVIKPPKIKIVQVETLF
jgi:hypothetical protein